MEQPDFLYHECPSCEFSAVTRADYAGPGLCPLCAEDNGRDVAMRRRIARDTDRPEGRDARKAD